MKFLNAEQKEALTGGNAVVRFLTVSYFVALALGVIPGTDLTVLTGPFVSGALEAILTSGVILVLATLILLGWYRRAAALALAICVFWASYLGVMAAPNQDQLGAFWRDLVLIGALIMTYADAKTDRPTPFQKARAEAAPASAPASVPRPVEATRVTSNMAPTATAKSRRPVSQTAIYREDLDAVRAS